MGFFSGIRYNLEGLRFGMKTPRLRMLGLLRLIAVVVVTVILGSFILVYHGEILSLIWQRPESIWLVWAWYLVSWLLSFLLAAISALFSYLIAQVLFSVVIMDLMSRITERMITGKEVAPGNVSIFKQLSFLVIQEIPRAILPVLLTLVIMILGWLTPAGPVVSLVLPVVAVVFLAWDNTDIVPARRLEPFKARFANLSAAPAFHLGFGILFLIPVLNILLLCFAPVGGTLYALERDKNGASPSGKTEDPDMKIK